MHVLIVISAHIQTHARSQGKECKVRRGVQILTSRIVHIGRIPLIVQREIVEQVTRTSLTLTRIECKIVSDEAVKLEMVLKVLLDLGFAFLLLSRRCG